MFRLLRNVLPLTATRPQSPVLRSIVESYRCCSTEATVATASENGVHKPVLDEFGRAYATGRRKTSSARVWISEGSGQFTINNRNIIDYFTGPQRADVLQSFLRSKTAGQYDVWCTVKGGGISGEHR